MSEKSIPNPEKKSGGEGAPKRDPKQTAKDLGRTALRGNGK
jgi:hypothetical protein